MSKYIVWRYFGHEGWDKSEEFDTLEECFEHLKAYNMGQEYLITKTVDVEFKEAE